MTRRGRHLLFWLVLTCGVVADLFSKHFVFDFLSRRADGVYDVWPGVFMLSRHYNTGGPFSILSGRNSWLVVVTLLALAVIFYLYLRAVRQEKGLMLVTLSLLGAGALGNLFDRVDGGRVRDFLNFYLISYPVFNIADILITAGGGLLVIELLRRESGGQDAEASHS